jgi:hypothetical protein
MRGRGFLRATPSLAMLLLTLRLSKFDQTFYLSNGKSVKALMKFFDSFPVLPLDKFVIAIFESFASHASRR